MRIIEITESKKEKMSGLVEEMLDTCGELMHCIKNLGEDEGIGERRNYRDGMGMRDGGNYMNRYDDRYEMGERRGYRRY